MTKARNLAEVNVQSAGPAARMKGTQQIHELAQGGYIGRAEPIIFMGDRGTGRTHLFTRVVLAACRLRCRVRFATAAALIKELIEAQQLSQLGRALAR